MTFSPQLLGSTLLTALLLSACQPESKPASLPDSAPAQQLASADNSRTAVDWPGSYQGVIPCADCSGIKLTLQLQADQQYQLSRYYQERADEPEQTSGRFEWSDDGSSIQLDDADGSRFLVGENRLLLLDQQGQRIGGELAAQYWLDKQQDEPDDSAPAVAAGLTIAGKWQLIELMQQSVADDNQVFLQFDPAGRVSGYTGCNNLTGSYKLQDAMLSFGPLATTRKACREDTLEPQFLEVLAKVDNISIAGEVLSLNRARMAPLARFRRLEQDQAE
ncbi:META domain-containing protein [Arsukibacterium sp. UBA3155]|uniref:META domain-containing protein n=1 Tax=Arsukibacterium sp. UBA3155 TaxID=1946058 RepID=UPI0025C3EEBE|nr:META domain-containing protein [Arsukibacterium sp. UBA3155]